MENDVSKAAKELAVLVQRASITNLENFCKAQATVSAKACTFQDGQTLKAASILLRGKNVKAWFRVYYSLPEAYSIIAHGYGIPFDEVTELRANDFFREFCNLCMGQVKNVFSESGVRVSVGLPQIMSGHPDSADWEMPEAVTLTASWSLRSLTNFNCSLRFSFVPPLNLSVDTVAPSGGTIEFF